MRIALVGPLAPWRGGLAQYLALLGEALARQRRGARRHLHPPVPGPALPGRLPARPRARRRRASRSSRCSTRSARSPGAAPPARARALRPRGGRPQVVDAVLRPVVRLGGGAFAEAWHPGRAGVRQSAARTRSGPSTGELTALDAAQLGRRTWSCRRASSATLRRSSPARRSGACRTRSTPSSTAAASPARAARARLGLDPEGEVVLFFGYVRRYKGLDTLLEALAGGARAPAGDAGRGRRVLRGPGAVPRAGRARPADSVRLREGYQSGRGGRGAVPRRRRGRAALPLGHAERRRRTSPTRWACR